MGEKENMCIELFKMILPFETFRDYLKDVSSHNVQFLCKA